MLLLSSVSAILYLLTAFLQYRQISGQQSLTKQNLFLLAGLALLLHAVTALAAIQSPEGVNLGFYKISSVIFWIVNAALLLSLLRRPLDNLVVILFPLAAVAELVSTLAPGNASPFQSLPGGMLAHIAFSILAYAVLTIAAFQAAAVAALDYQLRHRHTRGIVQLLPPLQLMETMLFEILWVGLALLSLAIGTGAVFLDDIFAQHLVHKTILSLCAWLVFATLLWGHRRLGWRSQTAVRFTLVGFAVLMLGYFGSKLVLEVILERV
jgi:ABC-type uncharacterized transport system permease subunit